MIRKETGEIVNLLDKEFKSLFISVPYNIRVKECHFKNDSRIYIALEKGTKHQVFKSVEIPKGNYEIVGFSSQLSGEQIKSLGMSYREYIRFLNRHDLTVCLSDTSNYWLLLIPK